MAPTVEDQHICRYYSLVFLLYYNFSKDELGSELLVNVLCVYEEFCTKDCL